MRKLLILNALLLMAATPLLAGNGKGNSGAVRVLHASPDAPSVDVVVNDDLTAFAGVAFDELTEYADLPAGFYNFKVFPTTGSEAVINADANVFFNTRYTVVALDFVDNIRPLVLVDDDTPVSPRKTRVRFVHASPNAPPVDIKVVDGPFLFQNVAFGEAADSITVPEGTYDLEVRAAGTDIVALELPAVTLPGGTGLTVFATGLLGDVPELGVKIAIDAVSPADPRGPRDGDDEDEDDEEDDEVVASFLDRFGDRFEGRLGRRFGDR